MSRLNITSLILRIGFGSYMLLGHGLNKFLKLAAGDMSFKTVLGMPSSISLILAVITEFILPMAVIVGFKTRWSAIPTALTMIVAAFIIHSNDPWFAANASGGGSKEMAVLFMLGFIAIALLGGGKYSLDQYLRKHR